jgi:fermentation-respiration switch protein FrsA (DUF1100 family)
MNFLFKKDTKKMNYLAVILLTFVFAYFLLLIFTYFFQRNLLYHPNVNSYSDDKILVNIKKVKIKTNDNIDLISWYHNKNKKDYKTILFLHGNAGSLENRIHKINHFKNMNVNFLIIAWRGFSGNEGSPSEEGLYEDANAAVRWLEFNGIKKKNIIIYGESLGTAIALEIAQNKNFAGIILESPFTSMIDAGKKKYPILPVKLLLKDKYQSDIKIKNIQSPILIMHGKADNLVPFNMGEKMYELADNPKYSYFTEYDNHMMHYDQKLVSVLKKFIKSLN